jgi:hypothetical protein
MLPPNYQHPKQREFQRAVGTAIAEAISASGVRHLVNPSSIGASLPEGTGPIAGLHEQEERLNALAGTDILHLRLGTPLLGGHSTGRRGCKRSTFGPKVSHSARCSPRSASDCHT